jgi:23S rRNA (guanosine2251-2'-O)-methyltransferase
MAGNSQRRGAMRKTGSKKGATAGSGGQKGKQLRSKGPTPPAEARTGHPAARRAASAQRRETTSTGRNSRSSGVRRPDGKSKESGELVVGRNSVVEALRAQVPATALFVASRIDSDDRVREAIKIAGNRGLPLLEAPRPELDRMSAGAVHQGLALQVPPYDYAHPGDLLEAARESGEPPLLVALDGVTDPRNLGAVVRSVAAFGGHGVLVPERRSAGMTAGAWKASAGAATRVRVARATNLNRALLAWRDAGCVIVGLAADGDVSLDDLEVAVDPLVLVVGSEGKGLSRLVGETCDVRVSIPMHAATESLNAGMAAAIVLHEVARRRRLA